ncbi:ferredoxin [soil metagenome]
MSSEATPHRVTADRSACCGYGTCVAICPEIYQLEGGLVVLTTDIVPAELLERAIEGADSCPQSAIVIEAVAG